MLDFGYSEISKVTSLNKDIYPGPLCDEAKDISLISVFNLHVLILSYTSTTTVSDFIFPSLGLMLSYDLCTFFFFCSSSSART